MKPHEFLAKLRNVTRDCHSDMVCDVFALVMEYTECEREKAQETRKKNAERQRQYRKLKMQCHSDSNSDTPVTELNDAVVLLTDLSSSKPLKDSQKEKKEVVARGSRISEEFQPSEESLSWAAELGIDQLAAQLIIDEFRDFWSAVPGAKGRKLDWDKTWKNRVREVVSRRKANGQGQGANNNGRTFQPGERFLTSSGKFF